MDLSFAVQPWADGTSLDDFFAGVVEAATEGPQRLVIVSAWAKRSGLTRVGPDLEAVRRGGGNVEMIIGISEGGATRQGLELAMALADRVEVFHDIGSRTFHPKIYLATAPQGSRLWVGSNNLTAGGLSSNYEAALSLVCDADHPVVEQVSDWIAQLRADSDCCKPLTAESLGTMLIDGRYNIGDEDARRPLADTTDEEDDSDSLTDDQAVGTAGLFSRSQTFKRGARRNPGRATTGRVGRSRPDEPTQPGEDDIEQVEALPTGRGIARWSKLLKRSDAQQTPAGTKPTGALRLSSSGHGIDQTTYFRRDFFGRETWAVDPRKPGTELASVEMAVIVGGRSLGLMTFRVDHNPNRESGQNNVTTVLKWGPMNAYLRANDHENDWVLIEKLSDGYRLSIVAADPQTRQGSTQE